MDGRFSAAKTGCLVGATSILIGLCGHRVSDDDGGCPFFSSIFFGQAKKMDSRYSAKRKLRSKKKPKRTRSARLDSRLRGNDVGF